MSDPRSNPLKAVLFKHFDTWSGPGPMKGDGLLYTLACLDCIEALTGEKRDDVIDEVEAMLYPPTAIATEAIKRWKAGEPEHLVRESYGLSIGQWGRIRGLAV